MAIEGKSVPAWISGLYLGSLAALYMGQRILVDFEAVATAVSGLAAAGLLAATAARFMPQFQGQGDHAPIAKLLSGLQLLGILGVALYWLTTDSGSAMVGLADSDRAETISTVLQVVWVFCIAASAIPLVFAEFALNPMRNAPALEVRRVRFAALSGLAIALAATYGSLLVYTAAQSEAQADFSYFKTSEPSEATIKLVQKLSDPLEITAFFPEVSEVRKEVKSYLSSLKEKSGNLEFTLSDRYLEPKKAEELRITQDGTLVLVYGETKRNLHIGTDIAKARATLVKLDQEINSRLNKIARDRRVAYLTVGHGELNDKLKGERKQEGRDGQILRKILEQQNYRVRDLGLSQGLGNEIPDDADLVMVLGPIYPFAPEEIASLKRYADGGGKVLMAIDTDAIVESDTLPVDLSGMEAPGADETSEAAAAGAGPNDEQANTGGGGEEATTTEPEAAKPTGKGAWLVQLAAAVGAEFDPVVLADESKHIVRFHNASDRTLLRTNRFSAHASVSTLSKNSSRASIFAFGAGHLGKVDTGPYKTDITVRSYATTFADRNGNFKPDEGETKRTYNLGVAITRNVEPKAAASKPNSPDDKPEKDGDDKGQGEDKDADKAADGETGDNQMRAFVFADADAFSDLVLGPSQANRVLAFDAVRWLVGEESLAGEFESEEDVQIEQTKQMDLVWFYVTIFGIPALVLGLGLTISGRARRAGRRPSDAKQSAASKQVPPASGSEESGDDDDGASESEDSSDAGDAADPDDKREGEA